MPAVGEPRQNSYAERVIRTTKEKEIDLAGYHAFAVALAQIGRFVPDLYWTKWIHSALGYLITVEFEAAWRQEHKERGRPIKTGAIDRQRWKVERCFG